MKKTILAAALAVFSISANADNSNVYAGISHLSQTQKADYGISTVDLGINHKYNDMFTVDLSISTPFTNDYNDWNNSDGTPVESGDVLVNLAGRAYLIGPAYAEVNYLSHFDNMDYGLTTASIGADVELAPNWELFGKLGTPITGTNNFRTTAYGKLDTGDMIAGVGVRFNFVNF